jgi:lipopolysaccharide export LptBFGC system permease protein LptF
MRRLVDPVVSDLQLEYAEARRNGSLWRARWKWLEGHAAVARVLLFAALAATVDTLSTWSPGERTLLRRTGLIFGMAAILLTTILEYMQMQHWLDEVDAAWLTIYVIPSALTLSIPFAIALAIAAGVDRGRVTRKCILALLVAAFACAVVMFADVAWIVPDSNQAFSETVFQNVESRALFRGELVSGKPARGPREMSLSELRRQISLRPDQQRRLAMTYHMRFSISAAPLILATLALAMAVRTRRMTRRAVVLTAFGLCIAYWMLLMEASRAEVWTMLPVPIIAWSPNIACALLAASLAARGFRPAS